MKQTLGKGAAVESAANVQARLHLAAARLQGAPGVRRAPAKALPVLRDLAHEGSAEAAFLLGLAWLDGSVVSDPDPREAAGWLRRAARAGLPAAQCALGSLYREGIGIRKNRVKAFSLYEAAAGQGDVRALYLLGRCCEEGIGCEPDERRAMRLYAAAARKGEPDAPSALEELRRARRGKGRG